MNACCLAKGFKNPEREVAKNITKHVYNEVDVIILIGVVGMRNVPKIWATACLDSCCSLNPKKYVKRGKTYTGLRSSWWLRTSNLKISRVTTKHCNHPKLVPTLCWRIGTMNARLRLLSTVTY